MREKTQNSIDRRNKFHNLLKWLIMINIISYFISIAILLLLYTNHNLSPD